MEFLAVYTICHVRKHQSSGNMCAIVRGLHLSRDANSKYTKLLSPQSRKKYGDFENSFGDNCICRLKWDTLYRYAVNFRDLEIRLRKLDDVASTVSTSIDLKVVEREKDRMKSFFNGEFPLDKASKEDRPRRYSYVSKLPRSTIL
ncbi:hypothetical protein WN51_07666 [Melipona quadrifasciata]|uniref:Uncharacterized protein n=1 Tax=Melipona quadrifasciata TaxID=166423 RepID=A0A0M8ZQX3_9HYME|nr:hypothetical protein WN51_07666 [Melipona quadrifasciata]